MLYADFRIPPHSPSWSMKFLAFCAKTSHVKPYVFPKALCLTPTGESCAEPKLTGPNFLALLTTSKESALADAGNSAFTSS